MDPGKEEQENEEKMELSQGVLSQLWALEQRAARGAALRQRQQRRRQRLQLLSSRVQELRQRRDRLRLQLREMAEGKAGIAREPGQVLQWRIRELQELLRLFPLTGVSAKLSRHGLSVSFHTSFEGSYLDCFHLELQESRECREFREFREWRVLRHSIPPFIPLQGLARELLPHGPRRFLALLARLLGAFVARRHQLHLLQVGSNKFLPKFKTFPPKSCPKSPKVCSKFPQKSQSSA
ncbi:centromere protein O-like [Passer domesticus]|uniref:centromere protein O-like n=1 Tax=Passer domesticus TaxID=48849 RepID=UPI0030FE0BBF